CRYAVPAQTPAVTTTYYTTRTEQFEVIKREVDSANPLNEVWTVTDRSGTVRTYLPDEYGSFGPGGSTIVARFHLASIEDLRGNTVYFDYSSPAGGAVPVLSDIKYNGTQIRFFTESRQDPVAQAVGGTVLQLSNRLKTIDVTVRGERARCYGISYTTVQRNF